MKPINTLPPFKRFCVTIGNLPSSYVDSMSYYECLMWLCKYLKDTVIPAINENAEAVKELQVAFTELKEYVDNYFENLDVQEEINNKLDEMVEDGTLEQVIAVYLKQPIRGELNVNQDGRFIIPNGSNITSGETRSAYSNAQGFCIVDSTHFIQLYLNRDDESDVTVVEYNPTDGSIYRSQVITTMGHANSCMYKDGYLYVTPYYDNKIIKYDYNTFNIVETYELSIPTKNICKDTKTNKVYLGNDTSIYEWEVDTTEFTKLFDITIPEFVNQSTGMLQDIACYNNYIYLLTSSFGNSKVIIFVFNLDGSIYTTYDLGTHNNYMYYGEGEGLDNIEDNFYMVTRYDTNPYNDYSVVSLNHLNPIKNIFVKRDNIPADSSTAYRIVNYGATNFFANGNEGTPFKYYFEFLIYNSFTPYNYGMSLYGSKQPKMRLYNENNVYVINNDNNCIIEGIEISNSNGILQGLKVQTNTAVLYDSMVYISKSDIRLNNCTIGNSESLNNLYCIYAQNSIVSLFLATLNSNVIPVYNSASIVNENCLSTARRTKSSQFQGKTIVNTTTSPISNGAASITFNDNLKQLLADDSDKQLHIMLHLNNTYNDLYFGITALTNTAVTTSKIVFIRDAGKIHSVSLSISYSLSGITVSITGTNLYDGTASSPYLSGSLNYRIIY